MQPRGSSAQRTGQSRGPSQRGFDNRPSNGGQHNGSHHQSRAIGNGSRPVSRGSSTGAGTVGGSWNRDQSGPAPRGRSQPRDFNKGNRFSSRGGQSLPRRDFGVRGLGNKEEIPHDLKPIEWGTQTLETINRVHYNVRLSFDSSILLS